MNNTVLETLTITVDDNNLDFDRAKHMAEDLAADAITSPMLIAWFDGKKGEEHPEVPECQHKPGWLAYAEGHGGRVRVDVNENEYSFIFADAGETID